jgi:hypothetical protein
MFQNPFSILGLRGGTMSHVARFAASFCGRSKSIVPFLAIAHFFASAGLAAEPVVAHMRNGRSLTGVVDAQTTSRRLWLRLTAQNIVALSSVDWRDVTRIEASGRNYSVNEFLPEAIRQKSHVPANVFVKPIAKRGDPVVDERKVLPRVRSLKIDAELANWDGDAEADGFELRISPLASDRNVVPVSGMLTVQLIGQNLTPDQMFEPIGENYSRLEYWSMQIKPRSFDGQEAVVRLPFTRIHPEFDVDVRMYGQLNASLNVDGQGVYDATVPVIMRTYSPLRERMQQYNRYRFFPGERTGNFPVQHMGVFPGDVTGR